MATLKPNGKLVFTDYACNDRLCEKGFSVTEVVWGTACVPPYNTERC